MAFRGKPRLGIMTLYIVALATMTFLLIADEIRWHRVLFALVACVGIFMECFVEDPRRES